LGKWGFKDLDLRDLKRSISRWQKDLEGKGWNSLYLSNHDQPRALSRFGNDGQYRVESAKMLATFLHTLQGTPYVYQGEEIGMTNVRFESIHEYRDIESLNMYREFVQERGMQPQAVLAMIYAKGRDNARTPMQWDAGQQAGFTSGTPWIQVNPNYQQINVAQAIADPNSIFAYYQQLIRLRKVNPVIVYGNYDLVQETDAAIYAYTRTLDDDRLLIILNFSASTPTFALPAAIASDNAELLISNYPVDPAQAIAGLTLRPYEARVYRLR
jgi:oligo-1,6-glucosidase